MLAMDDFVFLKEEVNPQISKQNYEEKHVVVDIEGYPDIVTI
jgi:hypothetical protein